LDVSEAKSGAITLNREMIKTLESLPGVEEVSPAFQITTQGLFDDLSADLVTIGTKPSFLKLGGFKATTGTLISDNNPEGVVISSAVAQVFNQDVESMIGKEIKFTFFVPKSNTGSETNSDLQTEGNDQEILERIESDRKYKIIGAVDGTDNIVYIHFSSMDNLNINQYGQAKVKTRSNAEMVTIRDTILEYGLLVSSLSDTVDQANQIFNVIKIILMCFGVIALIVSAIGMFNVMTITLLERTEEIGIMKSIGASDMGISAMFFMEAVIMGFLGGCAGIAIGLLLGEGFNLIINFVASRFGGVKVDLFYSPMWFVLAILAFSGIVGFFTGFTPARRASKIDPLDALRYK
jgi:putative ABC transport system permease protein